MHITVLLSYVPLWVSCLTGVLVASLVLSPLSLAIQTTISGTKGGGREKGMKCSLGVGHFVYESRNAFIVDFIEGCPHIRDGLYDRFPCFYQRYLKHLWIGCYLHRGVTLSVSVFDSHSTLQTAIGPFSPLAPPTVCGRGHLCVWNTIALITDSHSTCVQDAFRSSSKWCEQVSADGVVVGATPHSTAHILDPRMGMKL